MNRLPLITMLAVALSLGTACSVDQSGAAADDSAVYAAAVDLLFARDTAASRIVLVDEALTVDSIVILHRRRH
jgi:hypothetical protein